MKAAAGVACGACLSAHQALGQLRAEIRAQAARIEALERRGRGTVAPEDLRAGHAIRRSSVGDSQFSSAELFAHRRVDADLDEALGLLGDSPRSVGKLLGRLEGIEFEGRTLSRVAEDRDGIVWALVTPSEFAGLSHHRQFGRRSAHD